MPQTEALKHLTDRIGHMEQDVDRRLAAGQERFKAIDDKLDRLLLAVEPIPEMKADLAETRELVEAWHAAKTAGKFVKWVSGVAVAMAALIVAARTGLLHLIGRG